jgi:hypothetical protein
MDLLNQKYIEQKIQLQSRFGNSGVEKNTLPVPGIEPRPSSL